MLMCEDLLKVLETIKGSINGDKCQVVSSMMSMWCGWPGFFFDYFLHYFGDKPCNTPLLDRIKKVNKEPQANVVENTFNDALESLWETKSIKLKAGSMAVTGDELVHFLYYCHCLHGGNINCLSSAMAKLVLAGFTIMQNYMLDENKKSSGAVIECLVRNFLDSLMDEPDMYALCDRYIASKISYSNVTKFTIANQIIKAHTQPLQELLNVWGLQSMLGDFLDNMTMCTKKATSINNLLSCDPTDFFLTPLWHITMPHDRIMMLDISFFMSNLSKDYCLVTIQSKVTSTKLGSEELDSAI